MVEVWRANSLIACRLCLAIEPENKNKTKIWRYFYARSGRVRSGSCRRAEGKRKVADGHKPPSPRECDRVACHRA